MAEYNTVPSESGSELDVIYQVIRNFVVLTLNIHRRYSEQFYKALCEIHQAIDMWHCNSQFI